MLDQQWFFAPVRTGPGRAEVCCFAQQTTFARAYYRGMETVALYNFIETNRDEIIRRCRAKVVERSGPAAREAKDDHGVPLFLDQLCEELRHGPSKTQDIREGAMAHGHDLLFQEFTISEVVHTYGDVCQSVTDLAVELEAPISTTDFRTLNRCLDDAIAGAVTQYAREQDATREGESHKLGNLATAAITAFEVLRSGKVGVGGSTGEVIQRNLTTLRDALVERTSVKIVPPAPAAREVDF